MRTETDVVVKPSEGRKWDGVVEHLKRWGIYSFLPFEDEHSLSFSLPMQYILGVDQGGANLLSVVKLKRIEESAFREVWVAKWENGEKICIVTTRKYEG